MTRPPLMECGHVAQGTRGEEWVCVICSIVGDSGADKVAEVAPDLSGRMACCTYADPAMSKLCPMGKGGTCDSGGCDGSGVVPSSLNLAFFEHRPDHKYDAFYCGCLGWD